MLRPTWRGFIRLSLVSVPVQAFSTSAPAGGEIHLHQLHAKCHGRIRYQKVCPEHGVVSKDEIVMAYEYAKGQYVVIEPSEQESLHRMSDKAITIEKMIPSAAVDPIYFSGRNYYLLPDGEAAERPYLVLHRAMQSEDRIALGQVALSGRDELLLLRAGDRVLVASLLNYASQLKPAAEFEKQAPNVAASPDELRLARMLLKEISADEPHLAEYHDTYTAQFQALIEAKIEGREIVAPPEEEVPVINLMDALKRSLARPAVNSDAKRSKKRRVVSRPRSVARRTRKTS